METSKLEVIERTLSYFKEEINRMQEKQTVFETKLNISERQTDRVEVKLDSVINNHIEFKKSFESLAVKIEQLTQQPAKRYETLISVILTSLTAGLVGFFISYILRR